MYGSYAEQQLKPYQKALCLYHCQNITFIKEEPSFLRRFRTYSMRSFVGDVVIIPIKEATVAIPSVLQSNCS